MADPNTIAAEIRRLATGRTEWIVADPITGSHCIEFGKGNKAERQAKAWLRNLRITQPGHRFANYVVRPVHAFTPLERVALDAASLLDAPWSTTKINALRVDHPLSKGACLHGIGMSEHCSGCDASDRPPSPLSSPESQPNGGV